MTIYLDMDGTFVDLYAVENWLPKLRAFDPSPYTDAVPLCDMSQLLRQLQQLQYFGVKIGIISWTSKTSTTEYDKAVRKAKRAWLKANLPGFHFDEMHIVKYGTPKYSVAKDSGILIDDEEGNRIAWSERGKGIGYNPIETNLNLLIDSILENF